MGIYIHIEIYIYIYLLNDSSASNIDFNKKFKTN